MSCDWAIWNATGQNVKGALCYLFAFYDEYGDYYKTSDGQQLNGVITGLKKAGLPWNWDDGPYTTYKCLSPSQFESGLSGNFTKYPKETKCKTFVSIYEKKDYYFSYKDYSGYPVYEKKVCTTEEPYWEVTGLEDEDLEYYYDVIPSSIS